jgi:hypothetical protein
MRSAFSMDLNNSSLLGKVRKISELLHRREASTQRSDLQNLILATRHPSHHPGRPLHRKNLIASDEVDNNSTTDPNINSMTGDAIA